MADLVVGTMERVGKLHAVDIATGLTLCGRVDATNQRQFASWNVRESVEHSDGCARCRNVLREQEEASGSRS